MNAMEGYEKAWAAFLGGGIVTAITTLSIWGMSVTGAVSAPDETAIIAAITGFIGSVFAGLGAYIARNTTPTEKLEKAVERGRVEAVKQKTEEVKQRTEELKA